MQVSESVAINASKDKIWNDLRTLEDAENYVPMVTKSQVKGNGVGATRVCDVQMGDQAFQISERLEKLDDEQNSLTISIQDAPPPLKGLNITFSIRGQEPERTEVQINSEVNGSSDSAKMVQDVLKMIAQGLKTFHEGKLQ